jgi:DNA-binding winged helix-turn-helix (wHTH) protein/tetratricopeptide (TPR) repeat protein
MRYNSPHRALLGKIWVLQLKMMTPAQSDVENRQTLLAEISGPFVFDDFALDAAERTLIKDGAAIPLPPRAFDLLLLLVERAPHLVTKTTIMRTVWSEAFVEETNLAVAISLLRKQLGDDDAQNRHFIQTVPKLGYRFIASVRQMQEIPDAQRTHSVRSDAPLPVTPYAAPDPSEFSHDSSAAELPSSPNRQFSGTLATAPPARRFWLPMTVIAAGVLVAAAVILVGVRLHNSADQGPLRSVAVLPFLMDASSANRAYLGIGVATAINNRLTQRGTLLVPSGTAVARLSPATLADPSRAGRELGVDGIVYGTIKFESDQMKVTAALTRVSDGHQLWSTTFSQPTRQTLDLADVLEGEVAAHAATPLMRVLGGHNANIHNYDTTNAPAREFYLRGRYFWNRRTEESLRKGIDSFQKAISADPNYALAYAGLADSYVLLASYSTEPVRLADSSARSAALSAMHLDPTLAEPHASLGMISFYTDWDARAAEQEFQRAIALEPNYATAHHWYGLDLASIGRLDQALYEIRKAEELDPLSPMIVTNVGWVLYLQRHYAEAELAFRKMIDMDPGFVRAHTRLGITLLTERKYAEAIAELRASIKLSNDPYAEGILADALAQSGNKAEARRIVARLEKDSADHYVPPFGIALAYIGLAQNADALNWIRKAVDDHTTSMVYMKVDPELDSLRSDPGFRSILAAQKF